MSFKALPIEEQTKVTKLFDEFYTHSLRVITLAKLTKLALDTSYTQKPTTEDINHIDFFS